MKHSSSTHFSGIPLDTNTLAGQWMTFSHMANHYRKLLNVKPRVDTGIPHSNSQSFHSFTSVTSLQSSKKMSSTKKKSEPAVSSNSPYLKPKRLDSLRYSSNPDSLNASENISPRKVLKSPLKGKTGKSKKQPKQEKAQQYPEYQVVFGPSSIRSSSEAFVSDETDSLLSNDNKPPSEIQAPIGVTEKIRRFLNHIHQLDLTSSSKKQKRVTTAPATSLVASAAISPRSDRKPMSAVPIPRSVNNNSTCNQVDFRLSRHSKCFLPAESKSPKKVTKSTVLAAGSPTTRSRTLSGRNTLSSSVSSLHVMNQPLTVDHLQHHRHHYHRPDFYADHHFQSSIKTVRNNRLTGSGVDMHKLAPSKNQSARVAKSRRRAESVMSIGTICGSDELTPEDFPLSIKDICATLENGTMGDDHDDILLSRIMDDNAQVLKQKNKSTTKLSESGSRQFSEVVAATSTSNLLKSNSIASLVPSSRKSNTGTGNNGHTGANNNKDSSRDSAYGFSSGESRITTRESTPEKKCSNDFLLASTKGTYRSKFHLRSLEQSLQDKPSKDAMLEAVGHPTPSNEQISLRRKSSKDRHHRVKMYDDCSSTTLTNANKSSVDMKRRDSSERYITFLAELTQDIVSKGIYTNKGLKTLFKSHMEQNKELNPAKLADMLEKLRMDLGIPKDDALDKIEFGYGSVTDASSSTFFYEPTPSKEDLSTESVIFTAKLASSSTLADPVNHGADDPSLPHSSSATPSPTTIIPILMPNKGSEAGTTTTGFSSSGGPNTSSNNSTTTTDEHSGDMLSIPNSDHEKNHEDDEEEVEEDEELSLMSETEASEALKMAGLDDVSAEEVLGILKG